jgi:hypothetical protein
MQWASSLLIIKKKEVLKNQTQSLGNQMEIDNSHYVQWRNREEWRLVSGRQRQLL